MNKKVYEGLPSKAKQAIDKNRGVPMSKMMYQPLDQVNQELLGKLQNDPKHTVIIPTGKELEEWKAGAQAGGRGVDKGDAEWRETPSRHTKMSWN